MPAPEQLLTSLDALIRARLWPEVEFRLSLLEAYTQPPSLASSILLKRATAALHQRQLTQASTTLDTLLQRFPQGEHVAEAEYLLGQVAQRQGQAAESEQHYRRVMTNYPTSPWAAEALSELAALFAGRQQVTQAVELYERLAQDFPSHEKAADGLWEAGWGQYRQQHYGAAARIFRRFAELLPHADMLPQVLYWQARALHQQGQSQIAAQLYQRLVEEYPFHYYSRQAANRLREAGRPVSRTAMAARCLTRLAPPRSCHPPNSSAHAAESTAVSFHPGARIATTPHASGSVARNLPARHAAPRQP